MIDLEELCAVIEAEYGLSDSDIRSMIIELKSARKVVEAARDALDDMDRMFRTTQRLEDALKELDGIAEQSALKETER